MQPQYRELDAVQTLLPVTASDDAAPQGGVHHIPAGTAGTVLAVLGGGAAYEVEFLLREGAYDERGNLLQRPLECLTTVRREQIALASERKTATARP